MSLVAATCSGEGWEEPVVERAIFGASGPAEIATLVDAFCQEHLGSAVAGATFVHTSVGSVHGLVLGDGRRVVVKAMLAAARAQAIRTVLEAARPLGDAGLPLPRPLVGPTPIGHGYAWVEEMMEGVRLGAEVPGVTTLLATLVADLARASDAVGDLALPRMFLFAEPDRLWPKPHSPIFDFEATTAGAEWLDGAATRARDAIGDGAGRFVVGHHDVRVKHVRFDADPPGVTRVTRRFEHA